MTFLGALASVFLKKGSSTANLQKIIFSYNIYIGGILYVICALLNIGVLKYLPYSIVLPLTSITYIWTLILASIFFKEKIKKRKLFGTCLIIFGTILLIIN